MRLVPLLALAACQPSVWPDATDDAVATYAAIVQASYADSIAAAADLDAAVDAFLAAPSAALLDDARDAWRASREPYLQTEVFRFYDGPIDHPTDGPEGLLNAWPLDERYIDYVQGDDDAGLINAPTADLSAEALVDANEVGGEKNIATGYHAIEFLLWGQDFNDDGPGARPHTDFIDGGTAAHQDRRRGYLATVSDLLIEHLEQVEAGWVEGAAYRTGFEADAPAAFEKLLTGMIVLSGFETGGERLQASLDSGDQEDEHSCFSDNTHRDMVQDVRGIRNVWRGSYERLDGSTVDGVSARSIVQAVDATLADALDARIDESLALAEALRAPYDQEIAPSNSEGRARVQALVQSLHTQEELLFDVFSAFELTVAIPE